MKKSSKTISVIVEAGLLVLTGVGFYVIQQKQLAPTTVYQYSRDLSETSVITSSDITAVTVPRDAVTSTMVLDPNEIVGKAVDNDVHVGDYITSAALVKPEDVDVFANMDLSKYRQVAIEVDRQDAVGGNLASGDKVDLMYIAKQAVTEKQKNYDFTYAKTFMEDVLVYKVLTSDGDEYINQTNGPVYDKDGNRITSSPSIIILAVTADQAEEIQTRMSEGSVKIVGRFEDSEDVETTGYTMGDYGKIFTYYANPEE